MFKIFQQKFTPKGRNGRPGLRSEYVWDIYQKFCKRFGTKYGALSATGRKLGVDHTTVYHHIKKFGYKPHGYYKQEKN